MSRATKGNHLRNKGMAPGSLVFIGQRKMDHTRLSLLNYQPDGVDEEEVDSLDELESHLSSDSVTWLNLEGLQNTQLIDQLGKKLDLHPLLLEDVLDTTQRPKIEQHKDYLFLVLKMLRYDKEVDKIIAEQVSVVVHEKFVVTFQEVTGDVFEPLRNRVRHATTKIRHRGADYLAYALMDAILDNYLVQVEAIGERIEDMDDNILNLKNREVLEKVKLYKQEINFLRAWIRPMREVVMALAKPEMYIFRKETKPYLNDLKDMITYAAETVENYREMLSEQIQIFEVLANNRLNEVMRVLTVISVIFMPMSFLAGVYGTNFEHMPELHQQWAYPAFWGMEALLGISLALYFRYRKWL